MSTAIRFDTKTPEAYSNGRGTFGGGGASYGLGFGFYGFDLRSECACGKRVRVKGFASAVGGGLGLTAASGSIGASEFDDFQVLGCPNGSVFNGTFMIASVGIGVAYGCAAINLGGASAASCGPYIGFDFGVTALVGASAVVEQTEECCN